MAYISVPTQTDNGSQQVSFNPTQDLTSYNANKLLNSLFEPGVYNCDVTATIGTPSTNCDFNILAGTTLLFQKTYLGEPIIGKVVLQSDAVVTLTSTDLNNVVTYGLADSLLLVGIWDYNVSDSTNIYVDFQIFTNTLSNRNEIIANGDLILATFLNHSVAKNSFSSYKVSYQYQEHRNVLKNLYEVNNNFQTTFSGDGLSITIGRGNCLLGDTYISNTSTLTCDSATNWPTPVTVTVGVASDYFQIDVLRIKTETNDDAVNTPYLAWESYLKSIAGFITVETFIDGFNFTFLDQGYSILFAVRARNGLLATTPIWPSECLIVNPLLQQIGVPESVSRFKLPVY